MYHPPGVNIHPLRGGPGHWLAQELCSGGIEVGDHLGLGGCWSLWQGLMQVLRKLGTASLPQAS